MEIMAAITAAKSKDPSVFIRSNRNLSKSCIKTTCLSFVFSPGRDCNYSIRKGQEESKEISEKYGRKNQWINHHKRRENTNERDYTQ